MKTTTSTLSLLFTVLSLVVFLNPGLTQCTDNTFSPNNGPDDDVNVISKLSSGKYIVGGSFQTYDGATRQYIARINSNGTVDGSFSSSTSAALNGSVYTLSVQSDGKILVGGYFTNYISASVGRIIRLNSSGTMDGSFNTAAGTGANNSVWTTAIQADGKIIIGGQFTSFDGTSTGRVARLNSDGSLDGTFNPGSGPNDAVAKALIQDDGKIIIVGNFTTVAGSSRKGIARLNTNGSLDTSFDPGSGANNNVYNAAIQSDGKIVIVGNYTSFDGTSRKYVARLNSDGSLDATFNPGSGPSQYLWSVALQDDGKIFIGGEFTSYAGTSIRRIARLNTDGSLDNTFNPGTGTISGANDKVNAIVIEDDGNVTIGGDFTYYMGELALFITRIRTDQPNNLVVNPESGTVCNGLSITLDAAGADTYSWTPEATLIVSTGDTVIASPNSNTTYTVAGTTDGCTYYQRSTITVSTPTVTASASDTEVCVGAEVTVNGGGVTTYTWDNGVVDGVPFTPTETTTYTVIGEDAAGCQGSATVSVTVNPLPEVSANASLTDVCEGTMVMFSGNGAETYTWDNGVIDSIPIAVNATTTYTVTGVDANGCEDTASTTVTILPNTTSTVVDNICGDGYVSPSGNFTWTETGTYTDVIPNAAGCDSTITFDLTLTNTTSTLNAAECGHYVSPSGDHTWTSSGTYTDMLTNSAGCDSIVTINLTINNANTSISVVPPTLTASATGAVYQWLDCDDNYAEIAGETGQVFTATQNGNYAFAITENGCTDTSNCYVISNIGMSIEDNSLNKLVNVYPNPASQLIHIDFSKLNVTSLTLVNTIGSLVFSRPVQSNYKMTSIDVSELVKGTYFLRLETDKGTARKRLVIE